MYYGAGVLSTTVLWCINALRYCSTLMYQQPRGMLINGVPDLVGVFSTVVH